MKQVPPSYYVTMKKKRNDYIDALSYTISNMYGNGMLDPSFIIYKPPTNAHLICELLRNGEKNE